MSELHDLRDRMDSAQSKLRAMGVQAKGNNDRDEWIRLVAKADGVALAMSYVEEVMRSREWREAHGKEVEPLGQFDPRLTQADMPGVVRDAFGAIQESSSQA